MKAREELEEGTSRSKIYLHELFEEYDAKNRGYRDEILTSINKILDQLRAWRREDHEKRIIKLEYPSH